MTKLLSASDVERLAKAKGLSVAQLCERAGIVHSTFTRWRAGKTEPTLDAYRRFLNALEGEASPKKPRRAIAAQADAA